MRRGEPANHALDAKIGEDEAMQKGRARETRERRENLGAGGTEDGGRRVTTKDTKNTKVGGAGRVGGKEFGEEGPRNTRKMRKFG